MLKEILRSLKKDFGSSFFYWLTFAITSMFIFLFFTIAMSEGIGVTMVNARNDIATNLMIFSVILCSFDIMFANDFFIKKKAKDLAIRLVCGATYFQLATFLLVQTLLLLVIAIPVGILGGMLAMPIINYIILVQLGGTLVVNISFQAILWTALVLGYVVFWTIILNLAFAYRNSASQLLNDTKIQVGNDGFAFRFAFAVPKMIGYIFSIGIWIVPLIVLYIERELALLLVIFSLCGFNMTLKRVIKPLLARVIHRNMGHPIRLVYLGFFRNDLEILKLNISLYVMSAVILVSLLATAETDMDIMLISVTYVAMAVLLSLAIMFKLSSDIPGRMRYYKTLNHIGYMDYDKRKIIRQEIILFYGVTTIVLCIFLVNLFGSMLYHNIMTLQNATILMLASIIPLIVSGMINEMYYKKAILK